MTEPTQADRSFVRFVRQYYRPNQFTPIWWATVLLFALSPAIAPGSLAGSALLSMLPFAAILAIAAIGQTLVIQQAGLDLSVPGMICLSAVIVTKYPNGDNGKLLVGILIVLGASVAVGLLNGLAVGLLGITPLVATLGMNAVLLGFVQSESGGFPTGATDNLNQFALEKTGGIPNTLWLAVGGLIVTTVILRKALIGRRFEAVGANPRTARACGISVARYQLGAYVMASVCYGVAGILLAGFLKTPGIFVGNDYLLPSVAAVVLGGTALSGGVGSVFASAIGALFLTQLGQLVLSMGAETSVQYLIQGSAIAIGVATRGVNRAAVRHHAGRLATVFGKPAGVPRG